MLRVYPRAAQIKDDQDKLPIHHACQNGSSPGVINILLTTFPESINVKNGFGYTPLAEARSLENPKMDPTINILEKFKTEQDKIKIDCGENSYFDSKLDAMNKRVLRLEKLLGSVMEFGVELKGNVKTAKDPYTLIEKVADRLITLDAPNMVNPYDSNDSFSNLNQMEAKVRSRGVFSRKYKNKK